MILYNSSSAQKGIITGILMIAVSLIIYYLKGNFENGLQYIAYFLYVVGILWTLYSFRKKEAENKSFKNYFSEGFKCFIVVTLMMVLFTFIFLKLNPSLKEEMAINYKADLIKSKNYTAPEIETMTIKAKDYFVTMLVSMAIFGYLIIGALVTVIASAFFSQKEYAMDITIIIPLYNEEESLPELAEWIKRVVDVHNLSYEIIMIDDGSSDASWEVIENLKVKNSNIKGIKFQRNYGKSAALNEGFKAAAGDVVLTMDADLQDSPDEIPEMRRMIVEEGYDMVSGWKKSVTIIPLPKISLQNYLMQWPVKSRALSCTILTAG